jgi:hypothetical protein
MIVELFVLFLVIIAFLCWYGYFTKIRMFAIVGMIILFILSSWIILYSYTGKNAYGLEYKVGTNITTSGSNTVTQNIYQVYNDSTTMWFGFLLAMISLSGIFLVAMNDH